MVETKKLEETCGVCACVRVRVHMHEKERDVGIICVIIYDDLALEAWTQRKERGRD